MTTPTARSTHTSPVAGAIGVACGAASALFGGWNHSLSIRVIFMLLDYVIGLVVVFSPISKHPVFPG